MDRAIKKLEQKRAEWQKRAEYHRKEQLEAHDKNKEIEHRQLGQLATDTARGLGYAIEVLRG